MRTILLQKSVETKCLTNGAYVKLCKHSATNNSMLLLSSTLPYRSTITFQLKWQMAVEDYYFICFSHMWGILPFLLASEQLGRNVVNISYQWSQSSFWKSFLLQGWCGQCWLPSIISPVHVNSVFGQDPAVWYKKANVSYLTSFFLYMFYSRY